MILLRWFLLLVSAALTTVALGVTGAEEQPAALRLATAAALGVLAPLFWPGPTPTPWRTLRRVLGWSVSAAAGAALLTLALGRLPQPTLALLATCVLLGLLLVIVHAAAAWVDTRWPAGTGGLAIAVALVFAGALPLWAGPVAELLSGPHPGALDLALGASPLTHLAVVGGNDLLRNEWFYRHSNLAALPVSYPAPSAIAIAYAMAAGIALTLTHRRLRRQGERGDLRLGKETST